MALSPAVKIHSFVPAPEYIEKLQQAIRTSRLAEAVHEATWMGVVEDGMNLWSGSVEVFQVARRGKTERIFAWSKVEGGKLHCFVVGANEGIRTPEEAVRAVLSAEKELAVP